MDTTMLKPKKTIIIPLLSAALIAPTLSGVAMANENINRTEYYVQHVMQEVKNDEGEVIGQTRAIPTLYDAEPVLYDTKKPTSKEEVYTGGSKYFDEVTGLYKNDGVVKDIQDIKNGKMLLVEGDGLYGQIKLNVSDKTQIEDEYGIKLSIDDIKQDSKVIAYYGPAVTKSIPPIGTAEKIIVKDAYCMEGKIANIQEIKEGKMIFIGKDMYDRIKFVVSEKTQIVNETGAKLSIDDIKDDSKVKVYYGPIMTASIPPITNAKKIIVMDETNDLDDHNIVVKVKINGKDVAFPDAKPLLITSESRTITPVRFIVEQLGAAVDWDQENQMVTINLNDKEIKFVINHNYATVNGEKITFDSSAKLINNRAYVPIRFITEALGYYVDWDKNNQTVVLEKNDAEGKIDLSVIEGTVTNITDIKDGVMILIEGQESNNTVYDKIKLTINDKTQIINEADGSELSIEDIKESTKVKGYYGPAVTMSIPPISHAAKVIVTK